MKRLACIALLWLPLSLPVLAQSIDWRDQKGNPVVDQPMMKSKNGFGASLLMTPDQDWKEKWDTPPETAPSFRSTDSVKYGEQVTLLTFFTSPRRDAGGKVRVRCDHKITAPDGKVQLEQRDQACFEGVLAGAQYAMYLAGPVIKFAGDPGDLEGVWVFDVVVRDEIGQITLPLQATLTLKH
ncbi:hypothetical protein LP420_21615 [Massilia sp. B-10]|nr:hypothetical protein LP420_21615 [Massilia sp. B-10]